MTDFKQIYGPDVEGKCPHCDRDTRIKSPATGVLYSVPRYDVVSGLGLDSYVEYCIILLDNKEFISNFISRDAPSGGY